MQRLVGVWGRIFDHNCLLIFFWSDKSEVFIRFNGVEKIQIIETVIERKEMKKVEKLVIEFDPDVFYVVEDVRVKQRGIFPKTRSLMSRWRIGK